MAYKGRIFHLCLEIFIIIASITLSLHSHLDCFKQAVWEHENGHAWRSMLWLPSYSRGTEESQKLPDGVSLAESPFELLSDSSFAISILSLVLWFTRITTIHCKKAGYVVNAVYDILLVIIWGYTAVLQFSMDESSESTTLLPLLSRLIAIAGTALYFIRLEVSVLRLAYFCGKDGDFETGVVQAFSFGKTRYPYESNSVTGKDGEYNMY